MVDKDAEDDELPTTNSDVDGTTEKSPAAAETLPPIPATTETPSIPASLRMLPVYLRSYALEQMAQAENGNAEPRAIKRVKHILPDLGISDVLYAVGIVSCYMEAPTTTHFKTAKRILHYIKGTTNYDLFYSSSNNYKIVGYSDSDWSEDLDDRKSTTGFVFFMGNTAFTWMSNKQPIVTLSTCEAEYVAATLCVCHAVWLRNLLKDLNVVQQEPIEIRVDSKSGLALAKNPVFHERIKHIDTRYHYIRECIGRKEVRLEFVKSQDQAAYIFTKPLKRETFVKLQSILGVTNQV